MEQLRILLLMVQSNFHKFLDFFICQLVKLFTNITLQNKIIFTDIFCEIILKLSMPTIMSY